jgi:chemotaxis protein methyltransferase CheR
MSTVAEREREFVFTDADFNSLRDLARQLSGITLADSKRELVYGRVARRLRQLGMSSFGEYRQLLASDRASDELGEFTNAVTTNLTSFFRENHHFEYLRDHILLPRVKDPTLGRRLRIWSAACSTGEEPYSIAMTVADAIPEWERWDIRILATDLDTRVLADAARGVYADERVRGLPASRVDKHFDKEAGGKDSRVRIKPALQKMIAFRQLNLMQALPMKGPIDVIFCRNVIIYFDKETQRQLFARIAPLQRPSNMMFLGHSESLFKVSDAWQLIGKTIYRRTA